MIPDNIGNSPRPACIGIASNTDSEGEYSFLGRCIPDIHAYKQDQVADFSHRACEGELGPKGTGNTGLTTVAPVEMRPHGRQLPPGQFQRGRKRLNLQACGEVNR